MIKHDFWELLKMELSVFFHLRVNVNIKLQYKTADKAFVAIMTLINITFQFQFNFFVNWTIP